MGTLYRRGTVLWARYKDERGEWSGAPTGYRVGQEVEAERFLARIEERIAATRTITTEGPLTLRRYAQRWIQDRQALGLAIADEDETRLRIHVLPVLGDLLLADVRPRHIRELVRALRSSGSLASRTQRHIYATIAGLFRTAVSDELVDQTPCVLPRGALPHLTDRNPTWRAGATYEREELERIISDPALPLDRRMLYALKGLAGLRHGECAALRWCDYDTGVPLGRLVVARSWNSKLKRMGGTKTEAVRLVPVHPALAEILGAWRPAAAKPDDLIVPDGKGRPREVSRAQHVFHGDLDLLGMRKRRGHDLRRTFITLARVDGADDRLLKVVTHGRPGEILDVYTTFPWPALCTEIAKLQIACSKKTDRDLLQRRKHGELKANSVGAAGFEPAASTV